MMSRRLLVAGGGTNTFTVRHEFTVLDPPDGGWPGLTQAFYAGGVSYFGWADNDGDTRVGSYTSGGSVVSATVGTFTPDHHNSPGLVRRASDGKFVTVYCHHAAADIYRRISSNADDISSWAAASNIDSSLGGSAYTYPVLFQLLDEANDPIYLFVRDQSGGSNYWRVSTSTDGGSTWSSLTTLFSGVRWYARATKSSNSRLDFAVCDGSYAEDYASVYHFYYEGGAYYKSDGTSAGSLPLDTSDMTLVYDGSTEGARYIADIVNVGTAIAVVFPVQLGTPTAHMGEDEAYKYARWNGSAWTVRTPVTSVGDTSFELPEGGLAIDHSDLDRIAVSIYGGTAWRMWLYLTSDAGATWATQQLTSSGDGDIYPWFVEDHVKTLEVIWLKGSFTDQDTFDLGIEGYGTG